MAYFQLQILSWYNQNKRKLPWRQTTDPYAVWLSEIILQQTRVSQGTAYYLRFLEKWPNVHALAVASEQNILQLWQGLGYYSRARNMHATAKAVVNNHDGIFPIDHDTLLSLKGIGPYTAAAISSICGGEVRAVVDGNVYRVLSRYFGIELPYDSHEGKKSIQQIADKLIIGHEPGTFNQAVMELGALQCVPRKPNCASCPLHKKCMAYKHNTVDMLPVRKRKKPALRRYFNYVCLITEDTQNGKGIYLHHRNAKDIWRELYDFPLIESKKHLTLDLLMDHPQWRNLMRHQHAAHLFSSSVIKHQLTHQTIYAVFNVFKLMKPFDRPPKKNVLLVAQKELKQFPLPRLIHRFLETYDVFF